MDMLTGRTALVVGGAGAVGAVVCRRLVQLGCRVLIADGCSRVAEGTRLADALGPCARFELLHPTDEREWAATISDGLGRFGGLDAVVLVEPDAAGVELAIRTAGPHLSRRGGALVGIARSQAAAALANAGIPVVPLPRGELSEEDRASLASQALRHVSQALATSGVRVVVGRDA
jgi:hypothetical protein